MVKMGIIIIDVVLKNLLLYNGIWFRSIFSGSIGPYPGMFRIILSVAIVFKERWRGK